VAAVVELMAQLPAAMVDRAAVAVEQTQPIQLADPHHHQDKAQLAERVTTWPAAVEVEQAQLEEMPSDPALAAMVEMAWRR
jgi:hypothetical protein